MPGRRIARSRPAAGLVLTALAVVCLAASSAAAAEAASPRELYERAVSLDRGARARIADGTLGDADALRAIRSAVDAYRQVVWRYPRSGYCDNALWQGAQLSALAFTRFGNERDREKAVAQLASLISEYPSSSLIARARSERSRVERLRLAPPVPDLVLISDITRQPVADGVEIAIALDGPITYTEERLSGPARVFFDLANTRTTEALREAVLRFDGQLVRQVRIGHHPNHVTRVVLDLEGARSYEARLEGSPPRLVVVCRAAPPAPAGSADAPDPAARVAGVDATAKAPAPPAVPGQASALSAGQAAQAALSPAGLAQPSTASDRSAVPQGETDRPPAPAGVPQTPSSNLSGGYSIARQLGLGISRIVIDAGHGGTDTGALGASTTEAKVTLDIALRLERLLAKEPGFEVILTRRTDVFIPLQERGEVANRESADLFVSIHANASRSRSATGVETYLLNFATSPDAAAVAARENSSSAMTMSRVDDLVKKITLTNKVKESRDLAGYVQTALVKHLRPANKGLRDLGVKQAPFVVLVGASMPSILVEVSFISNRQEGRLLATPAYRQRIAEALLDGIRRYKASLKKLIIADGSQSAANRSK
ncbi:MAG: N-acetylmuramoyl-L-alanine amidase [Acidobacteriota bacterium]